MDILGGVGNEFSKAFDGILGGLGGGAANGHARVDRGDLPRDVQDLALRRAIRPGAHSGPQRVGAFGCVALAAPPEPGLSSECPAAAGKRCCSGPPNPAGWCARQQGSLGCAVLTQERNIG
eukprot:CAMPEP_0115242134 /NCGR_PEP_ID=MMETSP0270-20121206/38792_1 /TAXON_ID=71861 /ORGANISM="Scrippsiella trochoidea, Strain CCMP3099" /LENGTH=120 /DNA_ID=CAMNT_0002657183 /DNA_START=148 /DNA_END=509 /DNA_ORIENTATION=-